MLAIIRKPYPFVFSLKKSLVFAIVFGIIAIVLNYIRLDESFVNQNFIIPKIQIDLTFGILVFLSIILVTHYFTFYILSEETKDNWTISKELSIVALTLIILIVFIFSFLVLISKEHSEIISFALFLKVVAYALSTGLVIASIIFWINYTIILKENLKQTILHNEKLKEMISDKNDDSAKTKNIIVSIPSNIQNEIISFNINDLLFIKSEGNYIEVFTIVDSKLEIKLYRATMQSIEDKLAEFPFILRTHRTYIVNVKNIAYTEGNARNYHLFFDETEISIPVARSRFKKFNEILETNS